MKPFVTVFIPCYNEEANLENCVQVVRARLSELGITSEILIVDDGSQDHTGQIAERLSARYSSVWAVHHPTNRGVGAALLTALKVAQGEWMILIPADLALDPGEIFRYFEKTAQADIIVGLRSDRSDYTLLRRLVSWTNIHLIRALFGMKQRQFQYISMYRLETLREIEIEYWRSAFFLAEILIKARDLGKRLVEVEIRYAPRVSGKATGAKLRLVILTCADLLHFWLRRLVPGSAAGYARPKAAHP